ncbi:hypothetical protein GYMLUDRAFT_245507 [Collybiopsis luxurians FD-317 M1]|uniref:Unplaced genomic scaffold GYMLUscaffold_33, whole genome shotgun sequence n=1 Tax=Collybiopsis luxurians FD-317 M1 TaxID=944289 RepID=A0A0D0BUD7_9AGAR|nr:hypothetical protein GYMLUDRAFT_245507 [Collybiopsis luxurians FD-317 M1]
MPVTLTVAVYQVSPYTYNCVTAEFDTADRDSFARSLRERNRDSRLASLDEAGVYVFLTSPSICIDEKGAEDKINRWMEFFVSNHTKGEVKGVIEIKGNKEGSFVAWPLNRSLEQVSASASWEGFREGPEINCFVLPISSLLQKSFASGEPTQIPASGSGVAVVRDNGKRQRIIEKVVHLRNKIINSTSLPDLENPQSATIIPYPSLQPDSLEGVKKDVEDGLPLLAFRGRSVLASEVIPTLKKLHSVYGHCVFSMSGTYGTGVNYLATGAAVALLAQQYPVIFIPYISGKIPLLIIRDAILLALSNVENGLERWAQEVFDYCESGMMGFIRFCNKMANNQHQRFMFIVLNVDRVSQVEYDDLRQLVAGHLYCFTVDPNSERCRNYNSDTAKSLSLRGGLQDNEVDGWWAQYQAEASPVVIDDDAKDIILTSTGAVPSLLEELFSRVKQTGRFDIDYLQPSADICDLLTQQIEALRMKYPHQIETIQKIIAAALSNAPYFVLGKSYTDKRFIYENDKGCWTCPGLTILKAVRTCSLTLHNFSRYFEINVSLRTIPRIAKNRVMLGFVVEYAISNALAQTGLNIGIGNKRLQIPSNLSMSPVLQTSALGFIQTSQMFVPAKSNHRYVDFVIVSFEKSKKQIQILPVRITIIKNKNQHSDSCSQFFQNDWRAWRDAVKKPSNFKIKWVFLWVLHIEKSQRGCTFHAQDRSHPAYEEWMVDFDSINTDIGLALSKVD